MRCEFCNKNVVGHPNVVIVHGRGPAHEACFLNQQTGSGVFQDIEISSLDDKSLELLHELVMDEIRIRKEEREEKEAK